MQTFKSKHTCQRLNSRRNCVVSIPDCEIHKLTLDQGLYLLCLSSRPLYHGIAQHGCRTTLWDWASQVGFERGLCWVSFDNELIETLNTIVDLNKRHRRFELVVWWCFKTESHVFCALNELTLCTDEPTSLTYSKIEGDYVWNIWGLFIISFLFFFIRLNFQHILLLLVTICLCYLGGTSRNILVRKVSSCD